jgi:4-hydroxy-4-methyl-2-oxoglutarate aldolase
MSNQNLENRILNIINRNRISSTEVADVLGKTGVLDGVYIYNQGQFCAGVTKYIYTYGESNYYLHEQIQDLPEDCVVYIDAINCSTRAIFGHLVSKYLYLYKRVKGIVVNGYIRDAHRIRKDDFPIWIRGTNPVGCFNEKVSLDNETSKAIQKQKERFEGSMLICDDSGCTLVEKNKINEDLHKKLEFIELQEDIWYYCVDTLKWSTYDTICLKKYLTDPTALPPILKERLKQFKI